MRYIESPRPMVVGSVRPQLEAIDQLVRADNALRNTLARGPTWLNLEEAAAQRGNTEVIKEIDEIVSALSGIALKLGFRSEMTITVDHETARPGKPFRQGASMYHDDRAPRLTVAAPVTGSIEDVCTRWAVGTFLGSTSEEDVLRRAPTYDETVAMDRTIRQELLNESSTLSVITFGPGDIVHSVSGCFHCSPVNETPGTAERYFALARERFPV